MQNLFQNQKNGNIFDNPSSSNQKLEQNNSKQPQNQESVEIRQAIKQKQEHQQYEVRKQLRSMYLMGLRNLGPQKNSYSVKQQQWIQNLYSKPIPQDIQQTLNQFKITISEKTKEDIKNIDKLENDIAFLANLFEQKNHKELALRGLSHYCNIEDIDMYQYQLVILKFFDNNLMKQIINGLKTINNETGQLQESDEVTFLSFQILTFMCSTDHEDHDFKFNHFYGVDTIRRYLSHINTINPIILKSIMNLIGNLCTSKDKTYRTVFFKFGIDEILIKLLSTLTDNHTNFNTDQHYLQSIILILTQFCIFQDLTQISSQDYKRYETILYVLIPYLACENKEILTPIINMYQKILSNNSTRLHTLEQDRDYIFYQNIQQQNFFKHIQKFINSPICDPNDKECRNSLVILDILKMNDTMLKNIPMQLIQQNIDMDQLINFCKICSQTEYNKIIRINAIQVLTKIIQRFPEILEKLFNVGIPQYFINFGSKEDEKNKKQILNFFISFMQFSTPKQIQELVNFQFIKFLNNFLELDIAPILILNAVQMLHQVLYIGQTHFQDQQIQQEDNNNNSKNNNSFLRIYQSTCSTQKLELLQQHPHEQIFQYSTLIITDFFDVEEDN